MAKNMGQRLVHLFLPNKGKKLLIVVDGISYARYPVKTSLITERDHIDTIIRSYALPFLQKNDMLIISERIIAIMQRRSFLIRDIHPSWWAHFLSRFVSRHRGGIGLKSPYTMELALQEVGLVRILYASVCTMITKLFGLRGVFYHVVGSNINAIDGPCSYTLPPGNKSAKLGPKNPMQVAVRLSKLFHAPIVIIDANDYGVRVLGYSKGVNVSLVQKIFRDNPLGQSDEQTPLAIVSKLFNTIKSG
ncbi:MAG TPA: F420-0--gamma-glutamyl ligase [Patescibacteria group bacterium]|nr:F420-0--gamma-glutamyl ligase [Patescibacteria group bacterium]